MRTILFTLLTLAFSALPVIAKSALVTGCLEQLEALRDILKTVPSTKQDVAFKAKFRLEDVALYFELAKVSGDPSLDADLKAAYDDMCKAVDAAHALDINGNLSQANLLRRNATGKLQPLLSRVESAIAKLQKIDKSGEEVVITKQPKTEDPPPASVSSSPAESPADAKASRLGETFEQCVKRYGKPTVDLNSDGIATFEKGEYMLHIAFVNNVSELIDYHKPNQDDKEYGDYLDRTEMTAILSLSADDWTLATATKYSSVYHSKGSDKIAVMDGTNHHLVISTSEGRKHAEERAKKQAAERNDATLQKARDKIKGL